ncbi:MAG TPA: hypothetical protein VFL76_11445 [Edaphocola sp.]|nr:hypothetical protein [Edaphocola sp.]
MTNLIGRNTFIHTSADFLQKGDTIFLIAAASSSGYFFWQLTADVDCRVVLPGFQTNYEVTGSTLGPPADSFISNSPCQGHGTPVEPSVNTHVDGQLVQPVQNNFDQHSIAFFIFIKKT